MSTKKLVVAGAVLATMLAVWTVSPRYSREFVLDETKFREAAEHDLKSSLPEMQFRDMQLVFAKDSIQVLCKFNTLVFNKPVAMSVAVNGKPIHLAIRQHFAFKSSSVRLSTAHALHEPLAKQPPYFHESRITRLIEESITNTFAQVKTKDLDPNVRWYYWLNEADIRDGKIVLRYSMAHTTRTAGASMVILVAMSLFAYLFTYLPPRH